MYVSQKYSCMMFRNYCDGITIKCDGFPIRCDCFPLHCDPNSRNSLSNKELPTFSYFILLTNFLHLSHKKVSATGNISCPISPTRYWNSSPKGSICRNPHICIAKCPFS